MRKEELILLAKELSELKDLKGREQDLYFLKREYNRLINKEEETFFEKQKTDEFISYYQILESKFEDLSKSSLEDKKEILRKAHELVAKEGGEKSLQKELTNLFNNFKQLPRGNKEQDDELFSEFKAIREEANKKVDAYYANVKATLEDRKNKKEDIIKRAKEVLKVTNIKDATNKMNALMDEWKAIGFAGNEDQNLWDEFNETRKEFIAIRKAHFENMEKVFVERANKKEEIIKKVKYITSEAYFTNEEIKQIKDLENEFRKLGFAGKEKDQELWDNMQAAVKKYFEEMKFYK